MKQLNHIDDFIAYQAGSHIITLRWTNHSVYTVKVSNGEYALEDLGGTYPTETEARLVARGYAQMYLAEAKAREVALVADINTTMDEVAASREAARLTEDCRRIVGAGNGWNTARIVPTRTNVHCKPLTAVELDLIRNHRDGIVTTRPGQSWTILRAIVRRGYGSTVYRGTTRIIASVRLNARGLAVADEQVGAAA